MSTNTWATDKIDDQIIAWWRQGFDCPAIMRKLNEYPYTLGITLDPVRKRVWRLGLYENRNATNAQIARVSAQRVEAQAMRTKVVSAEKRQKLRLGLVRETEASSS
jgi:hypothetical protein